MPLPSVPTLPRTWAAGDLISAPRLRADVADAVAFLSQKPLFAGQQTGGPSQPNNTDTAQQLNLELSDYWGGHVTTPTNGATSSEYWAPVPGWYLCRAVMPFNYTVATAAPFAAGFGGTTGGVALAVTRGAVLTISDTTVAPQACDLIEQTLAGPPGGGGDYIQPTAWQASGGSVPLRSVSTSLPSAYIRWVCLASGGFVKPVPALAAVPSPITHAWLNANVRDAIQFMINPPICKAVYTPGSATLPSGSLGSPAVIDLTTVTVDNYSGFTTGAAAKYTAPVAGIYFVYGQFCLTSATGGDNYAAGLSVNGGTTQWGDIVWFAAASATSGGASVTRRLRLNAGDTVQLMGTQGSGSAIAYANAAVNQTRFIAVWDGI